jgi:hypothetical protein
MTMLLAAIVLLQFGAVRAPAAVAVASRPCVATPGRVAHAFAGELSAGEVFEGSAGRFILRLQPDDFILRQHPDENPNLGPSLGWSILVREHGRSDDLSQFTLPFSGPNPLLLWPWIDSAGQPRNAPAEQRDFYFSPEVGRAIVLDGDWLKQDWRKRQADIDRVYAYGHGMLDVLDYRSAPRAQDDVVGFEWIKFVACLSWPE